MTSRRIQQLEAAGIITRAARGRYDLAACTRQYIRYLRRWRTAAEVPASFNDLSRIFEVPRSTIRELITLGVLPKVGHGRFDLITATQSYLRYLRDNGQGCLAFDPAIEKSYADGVRS
jgi:hypothetical protein